MKKRRIWSSIEWKQVGARQGWVCACCSDTIEATSELDHIVPICCADGTNDLSNAQLLCVTCHKAKSLREEQERINALRVRLKDRDDGNDRRVIAKRSKADILESIVEKTPSGSFDFSQFVCMAYMMPHRRPFAFPT